MTEYSQATQLADMTRAHEKFTITGQQDRLMGVRWMQAEAGTGSRYAVVITPLPKPAAAIEGGAVLVSLLSPWQQAYALSEYGEIHASYVLEKLTTGRMNPFLPVHRGDLYAITRLIGQALDRPWFCGPFRAESITTKETP